MMSALERYRLSFIEYIGIMGGGGIVGGIITRLILKKSFYKNIGRVK
jgi:cellobiose-specific phosphotransferase system component IIC